MTFVEYCTALKIRTQYYVKHWIYRTVHPDDWTLPAPTSKKNIKVLEPSGPRG